MLVISFLFSQLLSIINGFYLYLKPGKLLDISTLIGHISLVLLIAVWHDIVLRFCCMDDECSLKLSLAYLFLNNTCFHIVKWYRGMKRPYARKELPTKK